MTVPWLPSMAVARVMTASWTPEDRAERAFSILGIMPPQMVPSATRVAKLLGVMTGMTELSSSGRERTPGFSKQ